MPTGGSSTFCRSHETSIISADLTESQEMATLRKLKEVLQKGCTSDVLDQRMMDAGLCGKCRAIIVKYPDYLTRDWQEIEYYDTVTALEDSAKNGCRLCDLNTGVYPERLIFLGPDTQRLVLSSELPDRLPYATLSHCWGTKKYLKLLQSNFDKFRVEIPQAQLSKTFRDAMTIARHLKINYLWIDSLCIIQDSGEDWQRESVRMSDIYGCSTLNLSATGAKDGSVGCFFDRDARDIKGIKKTYIPAAVNGEAYLFKCASARIYSRAFNDAPLLSRAWCFQERFLAHRTLHFTALQIFWECDSLQAYNPSTWQDVKHGKDIAPEGMFRAYGLGQRPLESISDVWCQAVGLYSRAKLTYLSDKLVAISGVARWHKERSNDEYLAGLWRTYLETQLLWHVAAEDEKEGGSFGPRPVEYVAPSWSWASVDKPVNYRVGFDVKRCDDEMQTWTQVITITRADIEPVSDENYFGQLKGGALHVAFPKMRTGIVTPELEEHGGIIWDYPVSQGKRVYFLTIIRLCDKDDSSLCFKEGIVLEKLGRGKFRRIGYWLSRGCIGNIGDDLRYYWRFKRRGGSYILTVV
ncbi:hypothetical protein DL770_003847 [Monosporascus sp. CRB-9-2]|nr:hypothetical protein DL770_003847 [Monosporascus sp. CRB-9-2]